jgi:hypothetical protein
LKKEEIQKNGKASVTGTIGVSGVRQQTTIQSEAGIVAVKKEGLNWLRLSPRDPRDVFFYFQDDAFRGRGVAFVSYAGYGNEYIRFRKISGRATRWNRIRYDHKLRGHPGFPLVITVEVHDVTVLKIPPVHVVLVHEDDPSFIINTAVTVVKAVDGRIELIMAANGHHE